MDKLLSEKLIGLFFGTVIGMIIGTTLAIKYDSSGFEDYEKQIKEAQPAK